MDHQSRARRVGLTVILCALLLRLPDTGLLQRIPEFLSGPTMTTLINKIKTGRNVRFSLSLATFSPHFVESPPAARPELPPEPEVQALPFFSGEEPVQMYYGCKLRPDLVRLLQAPLSWDLTKGDPAVLILHTHATESYAETKSTGWRTQSEESNMLSIGQRVAQLLEEAGIRVIRDEQLYDHPSYNGSYVRARTAIRDYLAQYPSIRLVLDLHRDAAGDGQGQLRTRATVDGQPSAQLMLVLGTNHDGYEENLSLSLKLHALLEQAHPGLMRPLQLRAQRFNQDLSPGALLVEVGAAGNTHAEAITAAEALARAVIQLAKGTEGAQSAECSLE